jgi:hypothetical protein
MVCKNCGSSVTISKSLNGGKSEATPDVCPECGAELSKEDRNGNRLEKGI